MFTSTQPTTGQSFVEYNNNNNWKWLVFILFIIGLIITLMTSSCNKKNDRVIVCVENYTYKDRPEMNTTVTNEYTNRRGNTEYLSYYNPLTGRMVWIKRSGVFQGTQTATLYGGEVQYYIVCVDK